MQVFPDCFMYSILLFSRLPSFRSRSKYSRNTVYWDGGQTLQFFPSCYFFPFEYVLIKLFLFDALLFSETMTMMYTSMARNWKFLSFVSQIVLLSMQSICRLLLTFPVYVCVVWQLKMSLCWPWVLHWEIKWAFFCCITTLILGK